jgi:hypothetical protein
MTEEEAMGLLDVAVMSTNELSPEQHAAMRKLSEFCRQFLRVEAVTPSAALPRIHAGDAPLARVA